MQTGECLSIPSLRLATSVISLLSTPSEDERASDHSLVAWRAHSWASLLALTKSAGSRRVLASLEPNKQGRGSWSTCLDQAWRVLASLGSESSNKPEGRSRADIRGSLLTSLRIDCVTGSLRLVISVRFGSNPT